MRWMRLLIALSFMGAANAAYAITCGSDQWCCRHDIGGTGECVKCCAKSSSSLRLQKNKVACVQLPIACNSNDDCKCSGCCSDWNLCQPTCDD